MIIHQLCDIQWIGRVNIKNFIEILYAYFKKLITMEQEKYKI